MKISRIFQYARFLYNENHAVVAWFNKGYADKLKRKKW